MAHIRIKFGGSNSKYNVQWKQLQKLSECNLPIRAGIGSKFFFVVCDDTPTNRQIVENLGLTYKPYSYIWE